MAEVIHSQGFAVLERAIGADRMQSAKQLAEAIELVEVARLRRAAAAAGEQGEAEAGVLEQRLAVMHQRRHQWYFAFGQLGRVGVLFEDRLVAPAAGAIELGDQRLAVFDAYLVDPVLVAIERQHAGVAEEADAFHGVEDQIGREVGEGMGHGGDPGQCTGRTVYASSQCALQSCCFR